MKISIVSGFTGKAVADGAFFRKNANGYQPLFGAESPEDVDELLNADSTCVNNDTFHPCICASLGGRGIGYLDQLRVAAFKMARIAEKKKLSPVFVPLAESTAEEFKAILDGLHFASYHFEAYKSKKPEHFDVEFEIAVDEQIDAYKQLAEVTDIEHTYVSNTKNLVNTPGSDLTPENFVEHAKALAEIAGVSVKVRDVKALKKEGFNGLVTVGKGSNTKPYMVTLSYSPAKAKKGTHLAIVGKGITFDCGGLCLKQPKSMFEMVSDMSGAAAALNTICAIAELKLPIKVTAVLCLAENRIGPDAVLPGDIFTAKNGKTVFVDNTDAEGRLILTDGLAEAGLCKATHIVDVATLTGAMVRALGTAVSGFFCNDEGFANEIKDAGDTTGEKFWEMPLEDEYADALKDKFADLKNTGSEAGAISAALFLKEFVPEGATWAHLDIAGTAFVTKQWKYNDYGATGVGVRTLIELARNMAK